MRRTLLVLDLLLNLVDGISRLNLCNTNGVRKIHLWVGVDIGPDEGRQTVGSTRLVKPKPNCAPRVMVLPI